MRHVPHTGTRSTRVERRRDGANCRRAFPMATAYAPLAGSTTSMHELERHVELPACHARLVLHELRATIGGYSIPTIQGAFPVLYQNKRRVLAHRRSTSALRRPMQAVPLPRHLALSQMHAGALRYPNLWYYSTAKLRSKQQHLQAHQAPICYYFVGDTKQSSL